MPVIVSALADAEVVFGVAGGAPDAATFPNDTMARPISNPMQHRLPDRACRLVFVICFIKSVVD